MAIEIHDTVHGQSGMELWVRALHSACLPEYCATARDVRMRGALQSNLAGHVYCRSLPATILTDLIARSRRAPRYVDGIRRRVRRDFAARIDAPMAPVEDGQDRQIRRLADNFQTRGGIVNGRTILFVFDEINPKNSYILAEE